VPVEILHAPIEMRQVNDPKSRKNSDPGLLVEKKVRAQAQIRNWGTPRMKKTTSKRDLEYKSFWFQDGAFDILQAQLVPKKTFLSGLLTMQHALCRRGRNRLRARATPRRPAIPNLACQSLADG
jgi:hypothetical protein